MAFVWLRSVLFKSSCTNLASTVGFLEPCKKRSGYLHNLKRSVEWYSAHQTMLLLYHTSPVLSTWYFLGLCVSYICGSLSITK
uniref:Secreted protein n=1 Tax=Pyxicephalus adspersus TaxID=30357 RepID=A0AAV3A6C6_PYXAD|nr:TPA: hypothetical protein GDO54_014086 [Pyxicephalus adspersus]